MLIQLSTSLPALAANKLALWATLVSVMIAALAGLDTQFRPGEQWKHHRSTQLALLAMKRAYEKGLMDKAAGFKLEGDPFESLFADVEELLAAEAGIYWQVRPTEWAAKHN